MMLLCFIGCWRLGHSFMTGSGRGSQGAHLDPKSSRLPKGIGCWLCIFFGFLLSGHTNVWGHLSPRTCRTSPYRWRRTTACLAVWLSAPSLTPWPEERDRSGWKNSFQMPFWTLVWCLGSWGNLLKYLAEGEHSFSLIRTIAKGGRWNHVWPPLFIFILFFKDMKLL